MEAMNEKNKDKNEFDDIIQTKNNNNTQLTIYINDDVDKKELNNFPLLKPYKLIKEIIWKCFYQS